MNIDELKSCKFAFAIMKDGKPVHVCCYKTKPTDDDLQALLEEMFSNKKFNVGPADLDKLTYVLLSGKKLKNFIKMISEDTSGNFYTEKHG